MTAEPKTHLYYLTVQDMIWINLQVVGTPTDFDFATLEEATYYQYGYGTSTNLLDQAARFLPGFVKKAPFSQGNAASALIGWLAFLMANGIHFKMSESEMTALVSESASAEKVKQAMEEASVAQHGSHDVEIKAIVEEILEVHASVIAALPK